VKAAIERREGRRYSAAVLHRTDSNRIFDLRRFNELFERTFGSRRDAFLAWTFAVLSYLDLARHDPELFGGDAAIYYRAALAFRSGTSPWDAFVVSPQGHEYHFAALPPTVLALLPFTEINERAFIWLSIFASVGAALWIVRRLGLPWWWLMFPPLLQGVYVANPQIILLALLLAGSSVLGSLAPMLKIYAFAPLIGERRYRALAIAAALMAASWLAAPQLWSEYLARAPEISDRLLIESWGGYTAIGFYSNVLPAVGIVGVVMLALVDFKAAGWLAGPALVPASQLHLSTMAMPVLARGAPMLLIVALAIPIRGVPPAAIGLYGVWRCYNFVRNRRLGRLAEREGKPPDST
jgi:hypothetical protein